MRVEEVVMINYGPMFYYQSLLAKNHWVGSKYSVCLVFYYFIWFLYSHKYPINQNLKINLTSAKE